MKLIKILVLSALFTSSLFAISSIDRSVLDFENKRFSKNKRIKINDIKINLKKQLPQEGWYGYIIDLDVDMGGNIIKAKDILFSNGEIIAPELFDIKTGMPLKDLMTPILTKNYYNKEHLISGNHNAKDKIVLFSDPLCPFCMDYTPDVIEYVKRNSNTIALYYYHFPLLKIHPASEPLSRLMYVARQKGIKDVELKVYRVDWDKYFNSKEKNTQKIVDAFNKEFNTSITLEEINKEELKQRVFKDVNMGEEMMVQGTPTIFINGEQDKSKLKYEMLGN